MVRSPASRGAPHRSGTAKILEFQDPSWTLKNLGSVWMSSPVVATIDGVKAVVLGTLSGEIYVSTPSRARAARLAPVGAPSTALLDSRGLEPCSRLPRRSDRPPSIIVGAGSYGDRSAGRARGLLRQRTVRFVFQTRRTFNPGRGPPGRLLRPVFATPAVATSRDRRARHRLRIVRPHIYALRPNGVSCPASRSSAPTRSGRRRPWRTRAIPAATTSSWAGTRAASKVPAGWIVDYRYVAAGPKLVWQRCTQETIWSSPTVGILNGTGRPAVVVGTSFYHGKLNPRATRSSRSMPTTVATCQVGRSPHTGRRSAHRPSGASTANWRSSRRPAPSASRACVCERVERLGTRDLVPGLRCSQRSDVLPGLATSQVGQRRNDVLVGAARGCTSSREHRKVLSISGGKQPALEPGCDTPGSAAVAYVPALRETVGCCTSPAAGRPYRQRWSRTHFRTPPATTNPPHGPNGGRTRIEPDRRPALGAANFMCSASGANVGYRLATSDGSMFDFGNLAYCGGLNTTVLPSNVVSMATTPDGAVTAPARRRLRVRLRGCQVVRDLRGSDWSGGPVPPGSQWSASPQPLTERAISSSRPTARCTRSVMLTTSGSRAGSVPTGRRRNCGRPVTGGYWLVTSKARSTRKVPSLTTARLPRSN